SETRKRAASGSTYWAARKRKRSRTRAASFAPGSRTFPRVSTTRRVSFTPYAARLITHRGELAKGAGRSTARSQSHARCGRDAPGAGRFRELGGVSAHRGQVGCSFALADPRARRAGARTHAARGQHSP